VLLPRARQLIGVGSVPGVVVAAGFACAILLAFVTGALPAWRGLRLQVAAALSKR
jgi:ABC-type antimicrobial peptide transport system permease subunit